MSKFRHAIWKGNLLAGKGNTFSAKEARFQLRNFGVLFAAITTGVSNLLMLKFGRKIIDFDVLFDAVIVGVSIFSGPRVNAGFVRAATAASSNCKRERSP